MSKVFDSLFSFEDKKNICLKGCPIIISNYDTFFICTVYCNGYKNDDKDVPEGIKRIIDKIRYAYEVAYFDSKEEELFAYLSSIFNSIVICCEDGNIRIYDEDGEMGQC